MNPVNPEAMGVFGLIATVFVFGLEQLGVGLDKDTDHGKLTRSLANIAFVFGGLCQLLTAFFMFLFDMGIPADKRMFVGAVFATFGFFWVAVAMFFWNPADKKVYAHFFIPMLMMTAFLTIKAFAFGMVWPLGIVLIEIIGLFAALVPAWYGLGAIYTKIAGALNIAIGVCSVFILMGAMGI